MEALLLEPFPRRFFGNATVISVYGKETTWCFFFFFVSLVLFLFRSKTASEFQPRGFFTFQLLFARTGYRIRRAWSFTVQESERASALGQGFDQIILLC